jgi:hypothetical protein
MSKQIIATTIFGNKAETLADTFATFAKVENSELHAFVFNESLPKNRDPRINYHLVEHDPAFVSVRRDALFRRWTLPDTLDGEFVLVVDGTDAICVRPLPAFSKLLRGASVAAVAEWGPPRQILGQGFTSSYLNAGVTFWHLPSSREMRSEVVARGRSYYRGPFDDQTALNEVVHTRYFEDLTILPSQFNWRALYQNSYRGWRNKWRPWPRLDCLDGVYVYHSHIGIPNVMTAIEKSNVSLRARLDPLPKDNTRTLSKSVQFWRRLIHSWRHF